MQRKRIITNTRFMIDRHHAHVLTSYSVGVCLNVGVNVCTCVCFLGVGGCLGSICSSGHPVDTLSPSCELVSLLSLLVSRKCGSTEY